MAKTNRSKTETKAAPVEPARGYGRENPDVEAGMGRLDNNQATPYRSADKLEQTVRNRQEPRQINAEDEKSEKK